jgi:hypothetical protein
MWAIIIATQEDNMWSRRWWGHKRSTYGSGSAARGRHVDRSAGDARGQHMVPEVPLPRGRHVVQEVTQEVDMWSRR